MQKTATLLASCLVVSGLALAPRSVAIAAKPLEQFSAFAVDMGVPSGRAKAGMVDITIDRWSTDEERARLMGALKEGGADKLLDALQKVKQPVGYIRAQGGLGYPLRFAQQIPTAGGGRRIVIATDRPVSFLELRNQTRTLDYPFMLIDLRVRPDGKGEGKLLPLAKVTVNDDNVIEIENYAAEPVRLNSVRKVT